MGMTNKTDKTVPMVCAMGAGNGHFVNRRSSGHPASGGAPDDRHGPCMSDAWPLAPPWPWYSQPMNYAQLLLPDFSLFLCSYVICRYTALNRAGWQPVESLVYYLLFPVLLFQSIVQNPADIGAASGGVGGR